MAVTVPTPPSIFNLLVVNASCSVAWGGQGGTLQLTLVEDPLLGSPDFPELGTACAFTFGEFYFAGIFQRRTYKDDLGGRTYDVVLESPAKILDGVQVIIDRFDGLGASIAGGNSPTAQYFAPSTVAQTNIFNVFGSYENYDLTSYQGYYGVADVNSVGMPVSNLLPRLQLLSRGTANSNFDAKIKYGATEYSIDLSEVMARMPNYLRIAGPVQNVNAILAECSEFAQFDYFVSIQEVGGARPTTSGTISNAELIIHVIDKQNNPSTGVIENFVQTTKSQGKLVSGSYGVELSDAVTQKVIVGGPASRYHVGSFDFSIPVWGKLADGTLLTGRANPDIEIRSGWWSGRQQVAATSPVVFNNTLRMNLSHYLSGQSSGVPISIDTFNPPSYIAGLAEIRVALAGIQVWSTYKALETTLGLEINGFLDPKDVPWIGSIEANLEWLQSFSKNELLPMDLSATSDSTVAKAYLQSKSEENQRLFNAVNRAATEFYLKKFLVPLPFEGGGIRNNRKLISEEFTYVNSWEITDSAQWTYAKPFNDVSFYDGSGRLKSVCTWPRTNIADYSSLGGDYAIALDTGHVATTRGGPEGEVYWFLNPGPPFATARSNGGPDYIPFALFDCGAQIPFFDGLTTTNFGLTVLAAYLANIYIRPSDYASTGLQGVQFEFPPDLLRPSFFGVPQQSPRYNYGPWFNFTSDSGRANVSFEEDLVPENYASFNDFNNAGFALVDTAATSVVSTESGYVEIAEIPQYNVASRFADAGPYVTNLDISLGTDGVKTIYKFNNWTPTFGKLARYNVDRLQRINKAMIAYLQRNRQRITKRPLPQLSHFSLSAEQRALQQVQQNSQDISLLNFTLKPLIGR